MEECNILEHVDTVAVNNTAFKLGAEPFGLDAKGRYDLVPWDVVADLLDVYKRTDIDEPTDPSTIFREIDYFLYSKNHAEIAKIIAALVKGYYTDFFSFVCDLAKHFEKDANEHGENHWTKLSTESFIDDGMRHLVMYYCCTQREDFVGALWNFVCMYLKTKVEDEE